MIQVPENSNRLLARQLRNAFPDGQYTAESFVNFIRLVNDAYQTADEDRKFYSRAETVANAELEAVNAELSMKNDFLDTFNHGMAHDIKNHTANIIGLVSMLRKYHSRNDYEMLKTIIDKIDLSANQLTAIVQGFLYLSRAEANIDNQFVIIEKEEMIRAIKAETLFLSLGRDCQINYNFETDNLFFSFHVIKIIFVNLISNSIKFSKKNQPAVINVGLKQFSNQVVLTVEDNGMGINLTDESNKIFQLFNRTSNTKAIKGTGVGLFMIKKIVTRHNGHVEIESVPDKGTTFTITIPLT